MPIKERIQQFKNHFNVNFEYEVKSILKEQRDFHPTSTPLDEPLKEIVMNYIKGGKRIRPFLISLFADKDMDDSHVMNTCIASELFHLAALIHDDIMDESKIRRGVPTIHTATEQFIDHNQHLGTDIALLLGDVFLTASIKYAARLPDPIFNEFTTMIQRTTRGQYLDSFGMNQELGTTDTTEVLARHELKTAWYTFISPARLGCMLNENHDSEIINIITPIFMELGLLYQIRDDIIDCIDENSGKPLFGDIMENQTTWVTLHIEEHYPELFPQIVKAGKSHDSNQIQEIFTQIDLVAPYESEFQKRAALIANISDEYKEIKDKAKSVLELLVLK